MTRNVTLHSNSMWASMCGSLLAWVVYCGLAIIDSYRSPIEPAHQTKWWYQTYVSERGRTCKWHMKDHWSFLLCRQKGVGAEFVIFTRWGGVPVPVVPGSLESPVVSGFNNFPAKYLGPNLIFTHLKLCLATATNNFKWVKIILVCLLWDQKLANLDI